MAAGYRTGYTYDALGSLRKVEQGAQRRYFAYDSLSRLLRARNPEQDSLTALQLPTGQVSPLSDNNNGWSLKYEYDEDGNLKRRTDARGVATDYTYDALNRVTFRDYSDSTPDVTYVYGDSVLNNSKGRLVSVGSSVSTTSYAAFDVMGRVTASSQATAGQPTYTMGYAYDLAGSLTSETYPSGRVVERQYDAGGRLAGVKKQGGSYYAGGDPSVAGNPNVIGYTAHGSVSTMRLGSGLWEHTLYNDRLQPTEIGLGTSATDSSKLKLEYGYAPAPNGTPDPTKNDGNVRSQSISVSAEGSTPARTFAQSYTYDALNRLESASEVRGAAETWRQTYSYDRYGNRRLDEQHTTKLNSSGATVYAVDSSSRSSLNPAISALTNRITEAGYTFDPSGNLLCDPQHPCGTAPSLTSYFDYDAENRMVRAAGGAQAGGSEYVYDGDRRRIKKVSGSAVSVFVYNAAGMLVAEYGGAQSQTGGVSYLTQDMLGSTRAVTGQNGEVKSRHDYLPFGGEIDGLKIPNTGREQFTTYNYGSVTQKFTGKERDEETGLDYSVNRYYSSAQGRFTGVDPLLASAKVGNPQTWNRYSYVLNRPAIAVDPNGLATIVVIISPRDRGGDGSAVVQVFDRNGHEVTISGRDTNRIDGIGIGGSPNRSQKQSNRHRGGDTPFGVYKILPNYNGSNESGTQGGVAGSSARGQDERFGTGIITLEPVSGEVKAAKRSTIYLHGGPPIDQGSQELKSTNGCVRCHNDDINALIQTVNDLMKDGDTVTNVFIGDTPTLNAIGDERDWDQSSLYPQLRRAGFGTPTENDPTGTSPNTKPGDTRRRNQN